MTSQASHEVDVAGTRFPRRFRRRLALMFVGACSVSAAVLAVVAFLLSYTYRWDRFEARARERASTAATLLEGDVRPFEIPQAVTVFKELGFGEIAAVRGQEYFSSSTALSRDAIPRRLLDPATTSGSTARVAHAGEEYHVIAHPLPQSPTTLYFFFSTAALVDSLRALGTILFVGWLVVTGGAGLVGTLLARRVLVPVRSAAEAAHAMAEGMLDTRLPVSGSDEFATWAISFNEMADALQRKLAELSVAHERERRFTGNVAHELMTPIGALVTEASVLEGQLGDLPDGSRRMVELVVSDIRRLRSLAEELLELARLDAADALERLQPVDLTIAVERAAATLRPEGAVVSRLPEGVVVRSDPACLDRVLTNLLHNGLRHGRPVVEVSAELDRDVVVLHVDDRGDGITDRDLPHVFDRFYKSDPSRSQQGAGLGLAIVRETVRLMGATVTASRSPLGGARFSIQLPVETV